MRPALLGERGFALAADRLDDATLGAVVQLFDALPPDRPGVRIAQETLEALPIRGVRRFAAAILGARVRIVRALLFDKRDGTNWALGWHQDRTIEIASPVKADGFGPCTRKQGRLHIAPPIALLEKMLTVRIHVDAVDHTNAPLLVAPGSHRLGFIAEDRIDAVVAACGAQACLAMPGDVWFYATPILHRSARAAPGRRRRVVQIDWCAEPLPGAMAWAIDRQPERAGTAGLERGLADA